MAIDRLGGWLIDVGVMAAAWLSLAMVAAVGCRQPIRRRDLARLGLVGALALVPLSLLREGRIGLLNWMPGKIGSIEPGWIGSAEMSAALVGVGRALTIGYAAIASAGISWSLLGAWAMRRLVRTAEEPSPEALRLYETLPFEGRLGRRPALKRSDRVGRPVLVGGSRPTIVIPTDWDRPGAEQADRLRLGMLHELAHSERSDPLFHWLAGLAQAVWFALPPAWWLARQLRLDQEILADDRAARGLGGASASYASSLVAMAAGRGVSGVAGRASGRGSDPGGSPLVRRVAMLIHCPFPIERETPPWWRWSLPPAAALLLLLTSRLSIGGLPGGSERVAFPMRPAAEAVTFRIRELEIDAAPVGSPLRLPAPLPRRFVLTMDLRADPGSLAAIAVAGHCLGDPSQPMAGVPEGPEVWRRIRLEVEEGSARLWIDGRSVPTTSLREEDSSWFSILPPPERPIRIRDLVLEPIEEPFRREVPIQEADRADRGESPGAVSGRNPRPSPRRGPS
ncbi:M56 family metallopeptidase [Tautonia sociabilis]|uniref:M56 family metallopeptidase n=1 Tax=Tautonia sociabilis TaxID=2080755 RepID=UPI001315285B|nr:M56 family metallopeptidase [Tautonia sociabilis]